MKRGIMLFLFLGVLAVSAFAYDYNGPWQEVCVASSGATAAVVTIEATADQNVFIDRIIARSDIAGPNYATLTLSYLNRASTSFEVSANTIIAFKMSSGNTGSTATTEPQVLGGNGGALIPVWIGDKGKAIQIKLDGTSYAQLIVNGRRGRSFTNDGVISKVKGY